MLFFVRRTGYGDHIAVDVDFHVAAERLGQLTLGSFHLKYVSAFQGSGHAGRQLDRKFTDSRHIFSLFLSCGL